MFIFDCSQKGYANGGLNYEMSGDFIRKWGHENCDYFSFRVHFIYISRLNKRYRDLVFRQLVSAVSLKKELNTRGET